MDSRDSLISGVTVIAPEAPLSYQLTPRTETATQVTGAPPLTLSPAISPASASAGFSGTLGKKKRGRPRKYGPDGTVTSSIRPISPMPISASVPPTTAEFSDMKLGIQPESGSFPAEKKVIARTNSSETKPKNRVGTQSLGDLVACCSGGSFTPHMVTVNPGEDVTMKIIAFSQQGPRAICILSAVGLISNVTLRQADSSGGTLTYEGRFEILSLSGSFTPTEVGGTRVGRSGGMSIALASPDGRVVGGLLAGLLIAAAPVQVVVGSFLPSGHLEPKPKKQKPANKPMTQTTAPAAVPQNSDIEHQIFHAPEQNNSGIGNSNTVPVSTDNWATMPTVQDTRKSVTDINLSLQGE